MTDSDEDEIIALVYVSRTTAAIVSFRSNFTRSSRVEESFKGVDV
jgi:hypothetical protein